MTKPPIINILVLKGEVSYAVAAYGYFGCVHVVCHMRLYVCVLFARPRQFIDRDIRNIYSWIYIYGSWI